jgi:hypothetical protein
MFHSFSDDNDEGYSKTIRGFPDQNSFLFQYGKKQELIQTFSHVVSRQVAD